MMRWRRVLLPTDFSSGSQAALQFASSLARDHEATLEVVHVMPIADLAGADAPITWSQIMVMREDARKNMEALRAARPEIQGELLEGDPAEEIVAEARRRQADLVVMGTHGRSGLSRLLMGSVAEHVARKASCPVVLIRIPDTDGEATKEVAADGEIE
jgi:nucleotide-binding universal stress UspA family protein